MLRNLNLRLTGADQVEWRRRMRPHLAAFLGRCVDGQFCVREVVVIDVIDVVDHIFFFFIVFRVEAD